ncbi:MAG: hypothetical protein QOH57_1190 [Mycobacterium sp.]|jgi:hypothetical protein|nr:hypothetical protein [Mycobacterium sp.]
MTLTRFLVGLTVAMAGISAVAAPSAHADNCGQAKPPLDAASKQVGRGSMLWISRNGTVGITTPGGTGAVQVSNAGGPPLQAFLIDAQQDGNQQLIISNTEVAHLYTVSGCEITAVTDAQGAPFMFDLQEARSGPASGGTGVDCLDLGEGRHLVGLLAQPTDNGVAVRRTQINLTGAVAAPGKSDTAFGQSQHDPVVASASTISCGDLTLNKDGVRQP